MILYRCNSCGRESPGKRALCPDCGGEQFNEMESPEPVAIVSSELTVTPAGFEDNYFISIGQAGKTKVLFRKHE